MPNPFPTGSLACQTIQLIEPDTTLPTVTLPPPGNDPSLTERGDFILPENAGIITINFLFPKAGDYRFEYLYVDALGLTNPGVVNVVPVTQTSFGFVVDLSGVPVVAGYILRWHVTVISISQGGLVIDAPENIRLLIPWHAPGDIPIPPLPPNFFTVQYTFINPRSSAIYGFSEMRVENVVDLPADQSIISIQICEKQQNFFKVLFNPIPRTPNYYLVARTP